MDRMARLVNRGRTRTLHVCNLANVAYGYCKILDEAGYPVALRCHDLNHLMSQPEWDDLELRASDFPDEDDFHDNTADFGDYSRPDWFLSCGIFDDPPGEAAGAAVSARVARAVSSARDFLAGRPAPVNGREAVDFREIAEERFEALIRESSRHGPRWRIDRSMLEPFQYHAWWLGRHLQPRDVVFAYVLAPIYAMLRGDVPYVSIEIGTMRDIPFDGTGVGTLLALAYRKSHHVLITNPDVREAAQRLGLDNYSFCPHPLDEEVLAPVEGGSAFRRELQRRHRAKVLLFAPARQNWEVKGNDTYFEAFARLRREGLEAALIVPGWGQEVQRSQDYCRQLGIASNVAWIQPQSELALTRYYQSVDFVLDQFKLGVFGLTTPKAMACGAIVLTSYDPDSHAWCFPEHPPLVSCWTAKEIADAVTALVRNPSRMARISADSREWVLRHHSKRVVRKILSEASGRAREAFRAATTESGRPSVPRRLAGPPPDGTAVGREHSNTDPPEELPEQCGP